MCVCVQWKNVTLLQLEHRLAHLTFVVRDSLLIFIPVDTGCDKGHQPPLMRKALRALSWCRWRFASPSPRIEVQLENWDFTKALVTEMYALPVFPFPAELRYVGCWGKSRSVWQQLPGAVQTCYSTWHFEAGIFDELYLKQNDLMALCRGAQARGPGCEKLDLVVQCAHNEFTVAERSEVEACVDRRRQWLADVQWNMGAKH